MCACEPGQKFNSDNECVECEFGSISDGQTDECTPCQAGFEVIENVCTPCPAGKREVDHKCEECPAGTTSTEASSLCSELKQSYTDFNSIGYQIATDDEFFYVPGRSNGRDPNKGVARQYKLIAEENGGLPGSAVTNYLTEVYDATAEYRGIAVHGDKVFLTCRGRHQVYYFEKSGTKVQTIGASEQVTNPTQILVDSYPREKKIINDVQMQYVKMVSFWT